MNMFLIYVLNWLSQTFKSEDEAELQPEEIFSEEAKIIKKCFIYKHKTLTLVEDTNRIGYVQPQNVQKLELVVWLEDQAKREKEAENREN